MCLQVITSAEHPDRVVEGLLLLVIFSHFNVNQSLDSISYHLYYIGRKTNKRLFGLSHVTDSVHVPCAEHYGSFLAGSVSVLASFHRVTQGHHRHHLPHRLP